jgi:putative acetyltransferase
MACGASPQYHSHMIEIVEVSSPAEMDAVRVLFDEYKKAVGVDLWFGAAFQKELDELPSPYLAPAGRLVVARDGGEVAGCGGLRPLRPGVAELRRLWVRRPYRKQGVGKMISEALIAWARSAGYRSIRLETLSVMPQAEALFRSLGFARIADDRTSPFPGSRLLELRLS